MVATVEKGIVTRVTGNTVKLLVPAISAKEESPWANPFGSGYPIPAVGDQVYVAYEHGDITKPLYFPPKNTDGPRGIIAGISSNASAVLATVAQGTNFTIPSTALTFTLPAGRWGRAMGSIYISGVNNNAFMSIRTYPDDVMVYDTKEVLNITQRAKIIYEFQGPIQSTWGINIENKNTSGGNITAGSDSVTPVWFTIEDVGPIL